MGIGCCVQIQQYTRPHLSDDDYGDNGDDDDPHFSAALCQGSNN